MRWIALGACLPLGIAASAAGGNRTTAACPGNLANQLASTGSALQLVTVVAPYRASTQGTLQLWRKSSSCWRTVAGPWKAWLGGRGVSHHKGEGDPPAPTGPLGFPPVTYGASGGPGLPQP